MEENKEKHVKKLSAIEILKMAAPLIIFAAVMAILTVVFLPEIKVLATPEGRASFKSFVDGIGILGWFVTLGIQLLQIFVALIPGEPVELMLGYVWGPWLGTLTCLIGIFIGTTLIYLMVKKLGVPFVRRIVGERDLSRYKFLSDKKKIELTVFIQFFILFHSAFMWASFIYLLLTLGRTTRNRDFAWFKNFCLECCSNNRQNT